LAPDAVDLASRNQQGTTRMLSVMNNVRFGVRWQAKRDTALDPLRYPKRRRRFALPAHSKSNLFFEDAVGPHRFNHRRKTSPHVVDYS